MRGHIIAEDRFLHQGIDHHLFVTTSDGAMHEFRFEIRRIQPGGTQPETIFEKTEDLSGQLAQCPNTTIDQLITAEMAAVKRAVFDDEDRHVHDP